MTTSCKIGEESPLCFDENQRSIDAETPFIFPIVNYNECGKLYPLPDIQKHRISRKFEVDDLNVDVTSIDITSHGCFVIAGCSNGAVLLFDMNSPNLSGVLVGHIRAKGLHTNLLLLVKISEDSRFAFAGVSKGSMEMLAIDLGRLPVWTGSGTPTTSKRKPLISDLVKTHSHFDPKLRGFGAVTRFQQKGDSKNSTQAQYRLVCGRGIKNLHIWLFFPDAIDGPQWHCLYDVASNGNTIESVGFRRGGEEVLSKSAGVNVRIWDLTRSFEEPLAKLPFDDIPNSQDARTLLNDFAFGGLYSFAVVRLGAPKSANRDQFEVPERSVEDDNGQRRRRLMRQIEDIISTQDGKHALALCTDGGVLYFRNDYENIEESPTKNACSCSTSAFVSTPYESCRTLTEFSSFQRDVDSEPAWVIRRIGLDGIVILLRAVKSIHDPTGHNMTTIYVDVLSEKAKGEVRETKICSSSIQTWNNWGFYHDSSALLDEILPTVPTIPSSVMSSNVDYGSNEKDEFQLIEKKHRRKSILKQGKPPINKKSWKSGNPHSDTIDNEVQFNTNGSNPLSGKSQISSFVTPIVIPEDSSKDRQYISPEDAIMQVAIPSGSSPLANSDVKESKISRKRALCSHERHEPKEMILKPTDSKKVLVLPLPRRVQMIVESNAVYPKKAVPEIVLDYHLLKDKWLVEMKSHAELDIVASLQIEMSQYASSSLRAIFEASIVEHDKCRLRFFDEITKEMLKYVHVFVDDSHKNFSPTPYGDILCTVLKKMDGLLKSYLDTMVRYLYSHQFSLF